MILVGTFGIIFGTRKLFSKKYTHAGSPVNTALPACCKIFVPNYLRRAMREGVAHLFYKRLTSSMARLSSLS